MSEIDSQEPSLLTLMALRFTDVTPASHLSFISKLWGMIC
ncbi:unnamed protein product [Arabidopsis halleri]